MRKLGTIILLVSIVVILNRYPDEAPKNPLIYCYAMFALIVGPASVFYGIRDKITARKESS